MQYNTVTDVYVRYDNFMSNFRGTVPNPTAALVRSDGAAWTALSVSACPAARTATANCPSSAIATQAGTACSATNVSSFLYCQHTNEPTVSFTDLDRGSEMIFSESISTTFKLSSIF